MIEGLVIYLESQIGDWQTNLDQKNVQIWERSQRTRKMMMYEVKDDKHSLEFTFD